MKLNYYGVRGSVPRPLTAKEIYQRIAGQAKNGSIQLSALRGMTQSGKLSYGGNTPCVELEDNNESLIIDAGSGLRALSQVYISKKKGPIHILLTHLHWDHIQGLPFFTPLFQAGREIHIYSAVSITHVKRSLSGQANDPYFPVSFELLESKIKFHQIPKNGIQIGTFKVSPFLLHHPQATYAYKVESKKKSYAHMSDTELALLKPADIQAYQRFLKGVHFISADSQFSFKEAVQFSTWGHSSIHYFIELLKNSGIKTIALYHYNPQGTEEQIDELFERAKQHLKFLKLKKPPKIICAIEGQSHTI